MTQIRTARLTSADRDAARRMFRIMAEVFSEESQSLSDVYLDRLLARSDFWAIAAFADDSIVGGITAHTLPMTRTETSELFIYDIAVRPEYQRRGAGRRLVSALRELAAAEGIRVAFVPADNDDVHALDFYRALGGEEAGVTFFTFDGTEG